MPTWTLRSPPASSGPPKGGPARPGRKWQSHPIPEAWSHDDSGLGYGAEFPYWDRYTPNTYIYIYIFIHICICAYTYIYIHIQIYVYLYLHVFILCEYGTLSQTRLRRPDEERTDKVGPGSR